FESVRGLCKKRRARGFSVQGDLALRRACGGYGAVYGAFAFASGQIVVREDDSGGCNTGPCVLRGRRMTPSRPPLREGGRRGVRQPPNVSGPLKCRVGRVCHALRAARAAAASGPTSTCKAFRDS